MIGKMLRHYRIVEKLGEGGMGVVYKAEDTKLRRTAALKFLRPGLTGDADAATRFIQEAQAAAALDHPNICNVYEIGEADGRTYIAMAYVEGESLKRKIESGPLDIGEAVNVAVQIAEGLREAHERGVIHRDIKPGNIMLTQKGLVKIMDFGLAKISWGEDITRTATTVGTVAYMSPEQASGLKVDHRTDIWALGCILYEMLAGRRAFKGDHDRAVIHAIMYEEAQPVSMLRENIPGDLEAVLRKCLQKDPQNRYRDAAGLLEALRPVSRFQSAAEAGRPSIAVLPFVDMSPQKDQEYFCDGIAEELINALTHIRDFRVVARTSAFAFKGKTLDVREIGRALNVDTILEGSIRKAGNRLRITAQLISIKDGYHIWSEKYDREMEDIFAIQDEISAAIVNRLKIKLLAGEEAAMRKRHTGDPEAYNLYLKGLYFANKPSREALHKALDCFSQAIAIDPNFALAYAETGGVYANLGILGLTAPTAMYPKARAAVDKALELDDNLAEAHAQAAKIGFYYEWDWPAVERSFSRNFALKPGNAAAHADYAWFCLARMRFAEAVREIKRAQDLDPLMPLYYVFSVGIHGVVGKPDEAIEEFHKAIELDPGNGLAYFHLGTVYMQKRMLDQAISALNRSRELAAYGGWAESCLGIVYLHLGERERAELILQDLLEQKKRHYMSAVTIGFLCGALGHYDQAFELLEEGIKERDSIIPLLNLYADMGSLRKDARFGALLERLNLPTG